MTLARWFVNLSAAVFFFLSAGVALEAKTLTFEKEECFVDVPEYWEVHDLAADHVTIVSPDHGKFFILQAGKAPLNFSIDSEKILTGLANKCGSYGYTVIAREKGELCGYRAEIFEMKKVLVEGIDTPIYGREIIIGANARVYILGIFAKGYQPNDDDELKAIVHSFGLAGTSEKSDKTP
jgi:hypothetical protein